MVKQNAQVKMKALVAARFLMGDLDTWEDFEKELEQARQVVNRRIARSLSAQIGRSYKNLFEETERFIFENFESCNYDDLARLCEELSNRRGLYMRLDEFSEKFFPLAKHVRERFPFYAHVSISPYGLGFELPEHHFLRDLEAAFSQLADVRSLLVKLPTGQATVKERRSDVGDLVSREKFLSRSIISASFSLVEAFLSGIFFTAKETGLFGQLVCTKEFLSYANNKESSPLRDRLDRVVKFASAGQSTGNDDPFRSFIEEGKKYRDAIHHTTPFGRKNIDAGSRLIALYEIDGNTALPIALFAFELVLKVSDWAYKDSDTTAIAADCKRLRDRALELSHGGSGSDKA